MERTTKKETFLDRFIKKRCCSSHNHPEGWDEWKKKERRQRRAKLKRKLIDIEKDM